jgi:putative transposase
LSIIDCHSRECLAVEVDTSLSGERVVRVLDRLRETRGLPQVIQTDNGPEFTGHKLDAWAYKNQVRLFFIFRMGLIPRRLRRSMNPLW